MVYFYSFSKFQVFYMMFSFTAYFWKFDQKSAILKKNSGNADRKFPFLQWIYWAIYEWKSVCVYYFGGIISNIFGHNC